jgi:hypothetical protein
MIMFRDADVEKTQAPIDERVRRIMNAERVDAQIWTGMQGGAANACLSDEQIVAELFKYHAPNELTIPRYAAINQAGKNFAEVILANCPRGKDRTAAIELIRLARMTANAAVSLNGLSLY